MFKTLQSLSKVFSFPVFCLLCSLNVIKPASVLYLWRWLNLHLCLASSLHPPPEANQGAFPQVAPPFLTFPLNAFFLKEIVRKPIHRWFFPSSEGELLLSSGQISVRCSPGPAAWESPGSCLQLDAASQVPSKTNPVRICIFTGQTKRWFWSLRSVAISHKNLEDGQLMVGLRGQRMFSCGEGDIWKRGGGMLSAGQREMLDVISRKRTRDWCVSGWGGGGAR